MEEKTKQLQRTFIELKITKQTYEKEMQNNYARRAGQSNRWAQGAGGNLAVTPAFVLLTVLRS